MNKSVKKCCICNNEKIGEFITINDKKYHLCCIEQLESNWNELKKWLEEIQQEEFDINGFIGICTEIRINCILDKMQELEANNE